jgi:hypothetical protein
VASGRRTGGIAVSLILASVRMRTRHLHGRCFPPVILSVYGGAWLITAGPLRSRWPSLVGFGAIAAALLTAWMVGQTEQWLVYALGSSCSPSCPATR